jgi:hypothetical protein
MSAIYDEIGQRWIRGSDLDRAHASELNNMNSPTLRNICTGMMRIADIEHTLAHEASQIQDRLEVSIDLRLSRGQLFLSIIPSHLSLLAILIITSSARIEIIIVSARLSDSPISAPSCLLSLLQPRETLFGRNF